MATLHPSGQAIPLTWTNQSTTVQTTPEPVIRQESNRQTRKKK